MSESVSESVIVCVRVCVRESMCAGMLVRFAAVLTSCGRGNLCGGRNENCEGRKHK